MLGENTQKMSELHKEELETKGEKEEWLRRNIKRTSYCIT